MFDYISSYYVLQIWLEPTFLFVRLIEFKKWHIMTSHVMTRYGMHVYYVMYLISTKIGTSRYIT